MCPQFALVLAIGQLGSGLPAGATGSGGALMQPVLPLASLGAGGLWWPLASRMPHGTPGGGPQPGVG